MKLLDHLREKEASERRAGARQENMIDVKVISAFHLRTRSNRRKPCPYVSFKMMHFDWQSTSVSEYPTTDATFNEEFTFPLTITREILRKMSRSCQAEFHVFDESGNATHEALIGSFNLKGLGQVTY